MSAIAGIVCLNKDDQLSVEEVTPILEAMQPDIAYKLDTKCIPECSAVLGRVSYAPDDKTSSESTFATNNVEAFCVGEIYDDSIDKYTSPANYIIEKYCTCKLENFPIGINGSFSAVIADRNRGAVILVTDHINSQPLFTFCREGRFYFASEVKGLLALSFISNEPDYLSALSLAGRGFYVGRGTLVSGIKRLDYGSAVQIRHGKVNSWQYWRFLVEPEKDRGRNKYIEELAVLLRKAVLRRVRTGRWAVLLSGGVDSRGIVACLAEPKGVRVLNYTRMTYETRHKMGDWALAEKIAQKLDMNFSVFHVNTADFIAAIKDSVYCSDGAAGAIGENIWDSIREETKIDYLLIGDQCMGQTRGVTSERQVLSYINFFSIRGMKTLQKLLRKDQLEEWIEQDERTIQAIKAACKARSPYDCVDELYMQQYLIDCLNPKRRVIARHGVGVRNPWLDLDVLNFIRKVPTRYRICKRLFIDAVKFVNPELFQLPRARVDERSRSLLLHSHVRAMESKDKSVSSMMISANPFFGEIFDISAVKNFAERVCAEESKVSPKRFYPIALIPMGTRLRLAALKRYVLNPAAFSSSIGILMSVLAAAEALRQLNKRFSRNHIKDS